MSERVAICLGTYPTRGLWGEVYHSTNDDGSNDGTAQHQPPSKVVFNSTKRDGDDITKGNTKRSPHLPLHDQGTTNRGRGAFRGVDRGSGRFGTDSKTEDETGNEKLRPGIGKSFPYRGEACDNARPKYTSATAN